MKRPLKEALLFLVVLFFLAFAMDADAISNKYDNSFRKWSSYYLPEVPWYWLKAQAYIESGLDPNAESPVGAKGIAQFMDYTWGDMKKILKTTKSQYNVKLSIQAQAIYMEGLRKNWTRHNRNTCQIHDLALASYNAGLGNILEAQRESGGAILWGDINKSLPEVTGRHSKETVGYVKRFWRTVKRLTTETIKR
jgi:membrane-bound lytic murein transglycosylase F